ncbi:MAG: hypothetical protein WBP54_12320 [Pelodictyon phaeoclathratiforme]
MNYQQLLALFKETHQELQDLPPSVLGATDVPFYSNNQMLMQKVILGE